MNISSNCPGCHKPLPPGSPHGLCQECLLKAALPTGAESRSTAAGKVVFVPPSLEGLAPKFPHVEILELLGRGGMGAVYKARQKSLDRLVALKILPPEIGEDPTFAERFAQEARALARLDHPGIVTVHEFGRADGLFYFVMEFVDGVTLRQLLNHGRVAPREALAIVPQICDALQYAHDHGIVHRDIKPDNILVDRRGRVKVADFGLAKLAGAAAGNAGQATSAPSPPGLTDSGKVLGTPNYMAPEQLERPETVDHRADIYALGVVFYQMLTGELPGKSMQPPSKLVQVDVRLDEVVLRALERDPGRRYSQASVLKSQVETIARTPSMGQVQGASQSPGAAQSTPGARLSILALLGLLLLTVSPALHFTVSSWTPPFPLIILLGLGATILGCAAVSEIRRSQGSIYGMRLAVFDVLFFPLAALTAFMFIGGRSLVHWMLNLALHQSKSIENWADRTYFVLFANTAIELIVLAIPILLSVWIFHWVWTLVHRPPSERSDVSLSVHGKRPPLWIMAVHAFAFLGAFWFFVSVVPEFTPYFADLPHRELPHATRLTVDLAGFLGQQWYAYIIQYAALCAAEIILLVMLWRFAGGLWARRFSISVLVFLGAGVITAAWSLVEAAKPHLSWPNPVPRPAGTRSAFPQMAHIGSKNTSAVLHHDDVDLHYSFLHEGHLTVVSRNSHNLQAKTWTEDVTLTLQNGRTVNYSRGAPHPNQIRINQRDYDLRHGRVFTLKTPGSIEQLNFHPSLAVVLDDLDNFARMVADWETVPQSQEQGPTGIPPQAILKRQEQP